MTREMFQILLGVFAVWGAAIVWKAVRSLHSGEPYTFSMWDGGMLRAGKKLSRTGTQIKVVVGGLMSALCLALLAGLIPPRMGAYVLVGVAVTSIIADLSTSA